MADALPSFRSSLLAAFPNDLRLPPEVWALIDWLEGQGQVQRSNHGGGLFLPTVPIAVRHGVRSHLAFVIAPEFSAAWFKSDPLASAVKALVRCGRDGSHMAIWQRAGKPDSFLARCGLCARLGRARLALSILKPGRNWACQRAQPIRLL